MDDAKVKTISEAILFWGSVNLRDFPWRRTNDPYQVMMAELLLQQTFARKVVPIYERLITKYPTLATLAVANTDEVLDIIRPLGLLYRASRVVLIAESIQIRFGGKIPGNIDDMLSILGIGDYIASCVLCFSFEKQVAIVDTNVLRVYRRIFGTLEHSTQTKPDKETLRLAERSLPVGQAKQYNWSLLDFAAKICLHQRPLCQVCPIREMCVYFSKKHYEVAA